ncbi:hypothetical protein ACS33_04845 [Edwardsiella ictaluri]|nr:hypothetical protein ABY58_04720 [Edwardsiella ictaluri]KOO55809.1 hypothetical protein ACS33_04845 [Edwardsiella ictaluri]
MHCADPPLTRRDRQSVTRYFPPPLRGGLANIPCRKIGAGYILLHGKPSYGSSIDRSVGAGR